MGEFKSPETVEAETMLAKAVGIMKADGKVDESELSVLRDIASRLGIGEGDIDAILNDPDSAENSLPTDPFKRALLRQPVQYAVKVVGVVVGMGTLQRIACIRHAVEVFC